MGGFRQDAEPAEWVYAIECGEHARWHRRAADAVEAIASGNKIADEFLRLTVFSKTNERLG